MKHLSLRKGFAFAAALLLVGAAIAVAVAAHGSGASNARAQLTHIAKGGDPDAQASLKDTPGEGSNLDGAAQEAAALRAYPADEVPWQAQINARNAFAAINAKFQASLTAANIFGQLNRGGASVGKFTPGSWQPIGAAEQDYPNVLTFFGNSYVDAGRTTAMAISPSCTQQKCQLWIGAAGGGIWRTNNALGPATGMGWQFVSGSFNANTIGNLTYSNGVLYAGLGETHACGDCGAGMGLYKSTDAGQTWQKLPSITHTNNPGDGDYTGDAFAGRAISSVVVDPLNPKSIWVGSGRGIRGIGATVTNGGTTNPPLPRPQFGLFHSLDGGQTFQLAWDGNGTIRGITRFALDPSNSQIMYASAYSQGLWRSINGGTTWTQIQAPLLPQATDNAVRTEFAVTTKNGLTRIYAQRGASGPGAGEPPSDVWRIDNASGTPVLTDITNAQSSNICTGQCWYDQIVYTPAGYPDIVYFGGSFDYSTYGGSSNGRGVILSQDAGASYTDMTADGQELPTPPDNCCNGNATRPYGALHPDQHVLVTNPNNPLQFFEGSDGGVVRSSGALMNASAQCSSRGLGPTSLARCQQLLSAVPTQLDSLNLGLRTLQFTSIWVDTTNPNHVQGGTQDNGTFETYGVNQLQQPQPMNQIMYGDGGNGGIRTGNPAFRVASFYTQLHVANADNGDPTKWYVIGGKIASSPESSIFYPPVLADPNPNASGTIFEGSNSVWRTQDWGGDPNVLKATCPEFTTSDSDPSCGDFVKLGATTLTTSTLGSRSGGNVGYVARAPQDTSTMWASTTTGRLFISQNVDANPASSVVFTRLDTLAVNSPGRAITAIAVDPNNANHAYVVYNGYNFNTPLQPGHVFSVTYNPAGPAATWTSLDNNIGDLPATSVAYDAVKDDLYVSNDFGVLKLPHANASWTMAGSGLPTVEVPDLKIIPGVRRLYAATHGLGLWSMPLPG